MNMIDLEFTRRFGVVLEQLTLLQNSVVAKIS